ncbi:hypothetical protein [Actinoplanes sp. NPDC089786]|uniref:hypothetical protein n=1 Tax=Actinoplanes sp. NPDC089786 TaxID=3155185 RepID=UPI003432F446
MPELDELLRVAADDATTRARPGDFDAVVLGARRRQRRHRWSAVAGAGVLAACVAAGTVVVVDGPDPAPPPPSVLTVAERDPVLAPLVVDIPVIAWTPDPGRSVDDAWGPLPGVSAVLWSNDDESVPDLAAAFRAAGVTGPAMIPTGTQSLTEVRHLAERLRDAPGVRDARVTTVRGMRFVVTVRKRLGADEKPGGNPLIGEPGIRWGASNFKHRPGGDKDWTMNAWYLDGGVDRAGLDRIRSIAATAWGIRRDQVIIKPQPMTP